MARAPQVVDESTVTIHHKCNEPSMSKPKSTIVFTPREVFSTTAHALETIFARTPTPFRLICVDGNAPPRTREYLNRSAEKHDFTLLRSDDYLTPNQARNLALPHIDTPYAVFVDNDVLVGKDWLEPLERCAEQTGAWAVGPLYFEHLPEAHRIHMAGGICRIEEEPPDRRRILERHLYGHKVYSELKDPILRQETELLEFHTMLVSMDAFREFGPLDERLLAVHEHTDLCLSIRLAGHKILLEPASQITYVPPSRLDHADRNFFRLRWSDAWVEASVRRMTEKWQLDPLQPEIHSSRRWARRHRHYGARWRPTIGRLLAPRIDRFFEKRVYTPIEALINRMRHPIEEAASRKTPSSRIIRLSEPAAI